MIPLRCDTEFCFLRKDLLVKFVTSSVLDGEVEEMVLGGKNGWEGDAMGGLEVAAGPDGPVHFTFSLYTFHHLTCSTHSLSIHWNDADIRAKGCGGGGKRGRRPSQRGVIKYFT